MTVSPDRHTTGLFGQPRSRYQIDCTGAQLHVHTQSLATVLRICGEIDAANAGLVAQAIRHFTRLKAPVILDLGGLDFLGGAGLEALLVFNGEHRQSQIYCGVVDGTALRRITQVVPDHGLPIVDSVTDALAHIETVIRAHRRFVYGPARQHEPQRKTAARINGVAS
ncbi:MAG TPA: STAS domain-containing protein [Mycobacterium sp.]